MPPPCELTTDVTQSTHSDAERQADDHEPGERDPPAPPVRPEQGERREARLQQDEDRRPVPERPERQRRDAPDDRVAGPGLEQRRRPGDAQGEERPDLGPRLEAPDRERGSTDRDRPPEQPGKRGREHRERHEQDQARPADTARRRPGSRTARRADTARSTGRRPASGRPRRGTGRSRRRTAAPAGPE